jgi:hypothetical protein
VDFIYTSSSSYWSWSVKLLGRLLLRSHSLQLFFLAFFSEYSCSSRMNLPRALHIFGKDSTKWKCSHGGFGLDSLSGRGLQQSRAFLAPHHLPSLGCLLLSNSWTTPTTPSNEYGHLKRCSCGSNCSPHRRCCPPYYQYEIFAYWERKAAETAPIMDKLEVFVKTKLHVEHVLPI